MALKEPDMNSPQCNWGLRYTYVFSSSEGAEYFKGSIFHLVLYQPPKVFSNNMSPFQGLISGSVMQPPAPLQSR